MSSQLSGHSPLSGQIIVGHQLTAKSTAALSSSTDKDQSIAPLVYTSANQQCLDWILKRKCVQLFLLRNNDRLADSFNESALKSFCARSESVIFQLFWRIDEKPSCLQSRWLMNPALGQKEEECSLQTTHYLPPKMKKEKEESWIKQKGI